MESKAGEDEIEWDSAKLEPLGSLTKGSMPTDIKVAINFSKRESPRRLDGFATSFPTSIV